ncbi:HesA/MoeB/ThiF family protein [Neisseria weaveri]|uniref:HesA/MoeB/ThiF family protein n=1 Tax=Neisseria weaveri TaxID=28091 RepID=UPI000D2F78E4|nr:HesA/MoeB/ThiF family protein [Neisseria weaveri]
MDDCDLLRYSRHLLLEEIDIEGQEKLLNACVLVIGCGGLGAAALPYLAASGINRLIIADDDVIDNTNLQRQITFTEADLGRSKAIAMSERLQAINSRITIRPINERLHRTQLETLMQQADIVLDCSDNYTTRQAVNQAAVNTQTPLVSGAAVRFQGQISVYRADLPDSPCYTCLFEEGDATDGSCATFGIFSPLVGIIGTTQASEALKILIGIGSPSHGKLITYDALTNTWQQFPFEKNPHCNICATNK